MSHNTAALLIAEAEAPTVDQTDTEDNPSPVPSANRINPNEAEAAAPANTADHVTPDVFDSEPISVFALSALEPLSVPKAAFFVSMSTSLFGSRIHCLYSRSIPRNWRFFASALRPGILHFSG
jgi:hypothetical protein